MAVLLGKALDKTLEDTDGKRHNGKVVLARLVTELVTTGQCTLPDGVVLTASVKDWLDAVKFVFSHIDGPAKASLDVTSNGASLTFMQLAQAARDDAETPG